MEIKTILLFLLYSKLSFCAKDPCEGWAAFKDEKCLKIFDQNFVNYTDAENICKNEDGAYLSSINTEEEQRFIENLLKSQEVVDNIWIGLKYVDESYVWVDGTEADYTNWASGNPSNDPDNCVELEAEKNAFGYWADVACTKKNIVMCEKLQLWTLTKLQSVVMDLIRNPVPVGFIYVQLPKEKAPQEVWPGIKWQDVSSDYAGLFFRTEGGNSAAFGEIQKESSPRLATVKHATGELTTNYSTTISVPADGKESDYLQVAYYNAVNNVKKELIKFQVSGEEVCPHNTAIKIWKRIL